MADRGKRVWGIAVLCVALALPLGAEAFLLPAALGFRPALAGVHATTTCMPGSRRPPGHHSMAAGLSMQSRGGGRGGGRGGRGGRGGGPAGAKKSGRMGKMVMQELMAIVRCVGTAPLPESKDPGPDGAWGARDAHVGSSSPLPTADNMQRGAAVPQPLFMHPLRRRLICAGAHYCRKLDPPAQFCTGHQLRWNTRYWRVRFRRGTTGERYSGECARICSWRAPAHSPTPSRYALMTRHFPSIGAGVPWPAAATMNGCGRP